MPQFFIDRPIFAWVLAILITLGGVIAVTQLPSEAYPPIAPPQVIVSTTYPGADAATVESTVTQVIEQQLTGIDNLLYFTSNSASDGSAQITLTFENGADPDTAAVQTRSHVCQRKSPSAESGSQKRAPASWPRWRFDPAPEAPIRPSSTISSRRASSTR